VTKLPQYGERYCHQSGWTVRIVNVKLASAQTQRLNPEFTYEVVFSYDSSLKYSVMPLTWFAEVYNKIADAPVPKVAQSLTFPPCVNTIPRRTYYSARRPVEITEEHYSNFL
jgi:hypothetical protein